MPRFTLYWRWLGTEGVVENVDVRWSIRGALGGARAQGITPRWKATVETVLPVDYTRAGFGWPLFGEARIDCEGEPVTEGPMRVEVAPPTVERMTPVRLTIGEDENPDAGTFPPSGPPLPVRSPGDVVDGRWVSDDTRRKLRGGTGPVDLTWEQVIRDDSEVFSNIAEPSDGAGFPYVIGAPGTARKPGSPAWWVDEGTGSDKLVIDGYGGVPAGASPTVSIFGPRSEAARTLQRVDGVPVYSTGGGSQGFAYVLTSDVVSLAANHEDENGDPDPITILVRADQRYFVSWLGGAARPGGAGSVLLSMLGASTLRWDVDAWHAVAGILDRHFTLAGYFDSPTTSIDLVERAVLPLLPLSIVSSRMGLRPVLDPWWGDSAIADANALHLVDGEGFTYGGDYVAPSHSPAFSRVSLRYNLRPDRGRTSNVKTADAASSPHVLLAPRGTFTSLGSLEMETNLVGGVDGFLTAQAIVGHRLRQELTPTLHLRFAVTDLGRWGPGGDFLAPGRVVRLTSERWNLRAAPAVVSAVEVDGRGMIFEVAIRADGVRGDLPRYAV